MIKYCDFTAGFQEIPGEVSLLLTISNCQGKCKGCHSPHLREDVGTILSKYELKYRLAFGPFTCVCLLGEGNDKAALAYIINAIHELGLKSAVYCGRDIAPKTWVKEYGVTPNFLKVGSYQPERGPLSKMTTNQKLFQYTDGGFEDITSKFWKRELKAN